MHRKHHLQLLGTSACHLCESATEVLVLARQIFDRDQHESLSWDVIDIAEDDDLVEMYGLRIPVIRSIKAGVTMELNWPFNPYDVLSFLNA